MLERIRKLFRKKTMSEKDNELVLPKGLPQPKDEIELCQRCPFCGKCSYPTGCVSYKAIVEKRQACIDKLRGYKRPPLSQLKISGNIWVGYMTGIGWRDKKGRFSFSQFRVVRIDGSDAVVLVKCEDENRNTTVKKELKVAIPMVRTEGGRDIVDIKVFRDNVRNALSTSTTSEWTPEAK